MERFRFWLSTVLIDWGIRLIPDEWTQSVVRQYVLAATFEIMERLSERSD